MIFNNDRNFFHKLNSYLEFTNERINSTSLGLNISHP